MSYDIQKIYTENPYVDVIIYYVKQLGLNTVLKIQSMADDKETLQSKKNADLLVECIENTIIFDRFDSYSKEVLMSSGLTGIVLEKCLKDKHNIPIDFRPTVLEKARIEFINNYTELNDYYRMLSGLPPIGYTDVYTDWVPPNDIVIDTSVPVHEMKEYEIEILEDYGVLDEMYEKDTKNRLYLRHLRHNIYPYTARKAPPFGILYLPKIEIMEIYNEYRERLTVNRGFTIDSVYSEAYRYDSKYYDNFIAVFIILSTMIDLISRVNEFITRREIFDIRTVKYLFMSFGIDYFPEIPMKYQIKMVKNIHTLLKYKSTPKCMIDICKLFGCPNVKIFKYYLLKARKYNSATGEYSFSGDDYDDFDLSFVKLPIDGDLNEYIRDSTYRYTYEEITSGDPTWDGGLNEYHRKLHMGEVEQDFYFDIDNIEVPVGPEGILIKDDRITKFCKGDFSPIPSLLEFYRGAYVSIQDGEARIQLSAMTDHDIIGVLKISKKHRNVTDYVKSLHLEADFNYTRTKYISIESLYDITKIIVQQAYFFNMLYDNVKLESEINLAIPYISASTKFNITDIFVFLSCLTYQYYGIKDTIMDTQGKVLKILGFNFKADLAKIAGDLYTMAGTNDDVKQLLKKFNIPTSSIPSMNQLMDLFKNNNKVRELLLSGMRNADNEPIYNAYKYVYDSLMIIDLTLDYFKNPETGDFYRDESGDATYIEYLKHKNYILYSKVKEIQEIKDIENKTHTIANTIDNTLYILEKYIDSDEFSGLFHNLPVVSIEAVKEYIRTVIEFYMSYKVQLLGINTLYYFDDKDAGWVKIIDWIKLNRWFEWDEIVPIIDRISKMDISCIKKDNIGIIDKIFLDIYTWIYKGLWDAVELGDKPELISKLKATSYIDPKEYAIWKSITEPEDRVKLVEMIFKNMVTFEKHEHINIDEYVYFNIDITKFLSVMDKIIGPEIANIQSHISTTDTYSMIDIEDITHLYEVDVDSRMNYLDNMNISKTLYEPKLHINIKDIFTAFNIIMDSIDKMIIQDRMSMTSNLVMNSIINMNDTKYTKSLLKPIDRYTIRDDVKITTISV